MNVHNSRAVRRELCPNVFYERPTKPVCCCLTPEQVAAFNARQEREKRKRMRGAA